MAPNGDDWNGSDDQPRGTDEDYQLPPEGQGWDAPIHEPPVQDEMPAKYEGDVPAKTDSDKLESEDYIPIVLSIIPGVGQMMMGQTVKGLVMLGLAIFTCGFGGLLAVASVLDAFLVASAQKRREVDEWEFFPDFKETFDL